MFNGSVRGIYAVNKAYPLAEPALCAYRIALSPIPYPLSPNPSPADWQGIGYAAAGYAHSSKGWKYPNVKSAYNSG